MSDSSSGSSWWLNVGLVAAGALVLVLAYALAARFVAPAPDLAGQASPAGLPGDIVQVEVLNGCGVPGIAGDVTRYLRDHDVDVVGSGNYIDFTQPHSLVIDRVGNREAALQVAAILGIDEAYVREELAEDYFLDASVVIGRDYEQLRPFNPSPSFFSFP